MRGGVLAAAALATVSLAACATERPSRTPVAQAPAPPSAPALATRASVPAASEDIALGVAASRAGSLDIDSIISFAGLPGWAQDDHAAAFAAFVAGCGAAHDPTLAQTCRQALAQGPLGEDGARAFLETHFRPERLAAPGLLTAYFTPLYEARHRREGDFTAPVRPRPADLPRSTSDLDAGHPYADRAEIDRRPTSDALAWMRPEDLLFLQIQGSGVLTFSDGAALRATFDGANGAPFVGLAAPMRRMGLLADGDTSAERIRAWLAENRGPRAQALIQLDPRYVFFRLEADDGGEPAGAAGLRLIPGRALAVDPAAHSMGEVLWLDASAPALAGAFPTYRRLAMALDTGGAIKGGARIDLYLGRGSSAGVEAGRVRHVLTLYRLRPVDPPPS